MTKKNYWDQINTPIGFLTLTWGDKGLISAVFTKDAPENAVHLEKAVKDNPYRAAFAAYFAGDLGAFQGLTYDLKGTEFQMNVWAELLKIPPGETRCYADQAKAIGKAAAVRAVGLANGRNPVSIAVPCHRVIGKDGSLTGYGGGLKRKAWLLEHEGANFNAFV
ncbi:MAG: methylated-DNA--[protein]-cysteine S-methyltransferase [Proteobacteria bacterium]|nr:methylated-DNA--[protein]-cysteine S-methyltransferase [Pseudomonadota bacterium]